MAFGAITSFFFCLLLLAAAPRLGSSYRHTSYAQGANRIVLRSPDGAPSPTTYCSAIPSGDGGGIARPLRVLHRLSPCSPHGIRSDKSDTSVGDSFYRDGLSLRALFGEDGSSAYASPAPAPESSGVTVPATGTPFVALPGASDYHVVVGYGAPVQEFPVQFDTASRGLSLLNCKPCAAGTPCDQSYFDPSLSSSLVQVPCGSPDCPLRVCSGSSCTFSLTQNGRVLFNDTVVTDTLTLSPSAAFANFRFVCLEMGSPTSATIENSSGVLDLSRDSHSLASLAPSSPDRVAFSYCLPSEPTAQGFLSIGPARPERSGRSVSYTTLKSHAVRPTMYFVQLAGLAVGGPDLPIMPPRLAGDSVLSLRTTFTYLRPDIYAALRDQFAEKMTQYRRVPPPSGDYLDTCYDFTGLKIIILPVIALEFDGGARLDLDIDQMMYFKDRGNVFSVGCLAFAPMPANVVPTMVAVVGTMVQAKTEVVYDVRGGKVGFIPYSC